MQSLYWVLTWACHRQCRHCYDDRFRPYVRGELDAVVSKGVNTFKSIIANLPAELSWIDTEGKERPTSIILAGGELLIEPVREPLFFPVLAALNAKYSHALPRIAIQTTGDVLTPEILDECLSRGVTSIAIASIDDYHVGSEGEKKFAFMEKIRSLMASRGVQEVPLGGARNNRLNPPTSATPAPEGGPTFLFFGAQPDLWIGELWPRGRAWTNGLSKANYTTNFCARWSGGKNFLKLGAAGSEVAIEPDGSVYPCCLKTKVSLGSVAEEPLEDILRSVAALPAIQAINDGDPERMGEENGWNREQFRLRSIAEDGTGNTVANMCLGCDAYFEEKLGSDLKALRSMRIAAKSGTVEIRADRR
jgi:MoaA/NifB/PqqE/SkfB family radical SAM enzyme